MLTLALPWPPSVNAAYRTFRGRMLLSKDGREYKKRCVLAIKTQIGPDHKPITGKVRIVVVAIEPDRRRRDLGNLDKLALDCITEAGVWADDCQVRRHDWRFADEHGPVKPGALMFEIYAIDNGWLANRIPAMEYAERNSTTVGINFRLEKRIAFTWDAASEKLGVKKGEIYKRLIAAYLAGRLGPHQTDLPMPPLITEEDIMAVAKKSKVAVKAKAAKPAAKTAAAKKK
jgi:crossover junction endodeoxyribonuclease RusA